MDTPITTASTLQYLAAGIHNLTLNFNGMTIRARAANGPYTLKDVKLYDSTSLLGVLLGPNQTSAHLYSEFQTPPITLDAVVSDQGIDLDGNGLYDYLQVDTNLAVAQTGDYHVQALLYDSDGNYTTSAHNTTHLTPGTHTVKLRFSGPDLFHHGVDGPYTLAYIVLYTDAWQEIDHAENMYSTAAYAYTQFEGGLSDAAITDATSSKTVVGQGYPTSINVTVTNQGDVTTTVNVTLYANDLLLDLHPIALTPGTATTHTFTWNTTGVLKGDYALTAIASPLLGDAEPADNVRAGGHVFVTIPGDVDANRRVNIFDIVKMASVYGIKKPDPQYTPNYDLDDNGAINIFDIVIAAGHYGERW
jgi:hypothetical protein